METASAERAPVSWGSASVPPPVSAAFTRPPMRACASKEIAIGPISADRNDRNARGDAAENPMPAAPGAGSELTLARDRPQARSGVETRTQTTLVEAALDSQALEAESDRPGTGQLQVSRGALQRDRTVQPFARMQRPLPVEQQEDPRRSANPALQTIHCAGSPLNSPLEDRRPGAQSASRTSRRPSPSVASNRPRLACCRDTSRFAGAVSTSG